MMTIKLNTNTEKESFKRYIEENWNPKNHNFSIKDNGDYYYSAMQDAWDIWIDSRILLIAQLEELGWIEKYE